MGFGTLLLLQPDGSRVTLSLEKTTVRVGRAADNDVVLDHPQVAEHHAQFLCDADGIQVLDLGSPAGTALDDQRLDSYELAPFRFGQRLQVGPAWLLLYREAEPLPAPEPPRPRRFWPPHWWLRWRERVRARQVRAPETAPVSASTPAPDETPGVAVASAPTSPASAPQTSAPSPSLLARARAWRTPEWVKRIFIWTWLKQNALRALARLLDMVGFFWLRAFLSRWLGISPDVLNPLQLLGERKEPASQRGPEAASDPALVSSAPVWREPLRGAPPSPPSIPVRRSELLHLTLGQTELAADPGRAAALTVTAVNRSPLVDRVRFVVDGVPEGWVSITPPALSLMPGDSGTSEIVIRPPRDASSVAGTHPLVVAARSGESMEVRAALAASLTITPFHNFQLDFQPQQRTVWRRGHYELRIVNTSNQTQAFELKGRDEAQALQYAFQPAQPLIPPGETALVQVAVGRRRPHWLGKPLTSAFHLLVEPAHRAVPAQQAQGRLTKRALSWSLLLLLLLLPVLLHALLFGPYAFAVAMALVQRQPAPPPPAVAAVLPTIPIPWWPTATPQVSSASPMVAAVETPASSAAAPNVTAAPTVETPGAGAASATSPEPTARGGATPSATSPEPAGTPTTSDLPPADPPRDGIGADQGPFDPWPTLPTIVAGPGGLPSPPVGEAPALGQSSIVLDTMTEGQVSNPGATVEDLVAVLDYRAPSGGSGGLAVVGVSGGRWQYTTTGSLWRDFSPWTSPTSATLLLVDDITRIRFVPEPDFNTEHVEEADLPQLRVRAWDGRLFRNGASNVDTSVGRTTGAFGAAVSAVRQQVAPVNDKPSFRLRVSGLVLTSTTSLVVADAVTDVRRGPANESLQEISFEIVVDPLCLTAAISDKGSLTLTPKSNVQCDERVGTVVLRDDGGTTNRGTDRSEAQTFTYAVQTRNHQPDLQNSQASLEPLPEDPLRNTGLPVSEVVLRLGFYDQDGDPSGLAVVGVNNTYGQWQYRTGEGDWQNLTAASRAVPLLLRASATNQVRFAPGPDYVGDATLTVLPWDGRPWEAASALGASAAQLHQLVRPVNDPPSFQLSRSEISVGSTDTATLPLFATVIRPGPENETGQRVAFDVVLSDPSAFASAPTISSDGTLTYRAQPNRKADLRASVILRDSEGGVSAPVPLTIRVDTLSPATTAFAVATGTAVAQTAPAQTAAAQTAAAQQTQQVRVAQTAVAQTQLAQQTFAALTPTTAAQQTSAAQTAGIMLTAFALTPTVAAQQTYAAQAQQTFAAQTPTAAAQQTYAAQAQQTSVSQTQTAQTQATAYAATATAVAAVEPKSLRILTSPASLVAGQPFTVEVLLIDGFGRVATSTGNGYIISLQMLDSNDQNQASNWSSVESQNGRAKFTRITFTKAGSYWLSAVADRGILAPSNQPAIQITPGPAIQFVFSCFIESGQTECPSTPVYQFTADQQFGFIAKALDRFGNVDPNFWGEATITFYNSGDYRSSFKSTFIAGKLVVSSVRSPIGEVGSQFYYLIEAPSLSMGLYTQTFTVVPGVPAQVILYDATFVFLQPVNYPPFRVAVVDSRQNRVQTNVEVCFKTDALSSFSPDLIFTYGQINGRFGSVGFTGSSGIAESPPVVPNNYDGSYSLYAYTQPDGGCDINLDVSNLPVAPYIYISTTLTNATTNMPY